jgi:hypothetical protein
MWKVKNFSSRQCLISSAGHHETGRQNFTHHCGTRLPVCFTKVNTRCAIDLGLNNLLLVSPRCIECKLLVYETFIDFIYLRVRSLAKKESAAVAGSKNSKTTLQPTSASKVETQLITSVDNSTGDEHTSLPSVTSAEIISSLVPEQSIVESLQKDLNKPSVIKNVSSSTNLISPRSCYLLVCSQQSRPFYQDIIKCKSLAFLTSLRTKCTFQNKCVVIMTIKVLGVLRDFLTLLG